MSQSVCRVSKETMSDWLHLYLLRAPWSRGRGEGDRLEALTLSASLPALSLPLPLSGSLGLSLLPLSYSLLNRSVSLSSLYLLPRSSASCLLCRSLSLSCRRSEPHGSALPASRSQCLLSLSPLRSTSLPSGTRSRRFNDLSPFDWPCFLPSTCSSSSLESSAFSSLRSGAWGAALLGSLAGAGERDELSLLFRLRGGGDSGGPLLSGEGSRAGGGRFLSATYEMVAFKAQQAARLHDHGNVWSSSPHIDFVQFSGCSLCYQWQR